jgi:hypothetical protein
MLLQEGERCQNASEVTRVAASYPNVKLWKKDGGRLLNIIKIYKQQMCYYVF